MKRQQRESGFTFIEVMTVIIILGLLVSIVAPRFFGQTEKAKVTATRTQIDSSLATALELYQLDNHHFPSSQQGLKALIEKPTGSPEASNWGGPYLKKKLIPKDSWGKDFIYVSPGVQNKTEYDLSSLGPDGIESDDDVTNWAKETVNPEK